MYCVKCGVKLADTEKTCPLCGTRVYHPDILQEEKNMIYPQKSYPKSEGKSLGLPIFLTVVFAVPLLTVLVCDLRFTNAITWSGIVAGALVILYLMFALPTWFQTPHPVVFVPCSFGAVGIYLFYLNWILGGRWFLSLALPILGCIAAITITVLVLLKYVRGGKLFIFGGMFIAIGGMMLLIEFLLDITFRKVEFIGWSFTPLTTLGLIGGFLIFLGICRPAREAMERIFFI